MSSSCFIGDVLSISTALAVQEGQGADLHGGVSERVPEAPPGPPHHAVVARTLVLSATVEPSVQVGCVASEDHRSEARDDRRERGRHTVGRAELSESLKSENTHLLNHQPPMFSLAQLPCRKRSLSCQKDPTLLLLSTMLVAILLFVH